MSLLECLELKAIIKIFFSSFFVWTEFRIQMFLRAENSQDTQNAATEFTSPKNTSVTSDSSVLILLQHLHKSMIDVLNI